MRHQPLLAVFILAFCTAACGDDDPATGASNAPPSSSSSSSGAPAADLGEAAAARCPTQDLLIQGTLWVNCVAGTSLGGVEPFTRNACDLTFDATGGLTYSLGGAAIFTAPKTSWGKSATGTYANSGSGPSRIFLASVSPELPHVEGQARLLGVSVSISGVAKSEDTIEVQYLDVSGARQTYNCTIESR